MNTSGMLERRKNMKGRIVGSLILAIFLVVFIGCTDPYGLSSASLTPSTPYITLEEVSRPFLDKYGPPEKIKSYTSGKYNTINYWWWTQMYEVTFMETLYDDVNGWKVESIIDSDSEFWKYVDLT
jgi:hypothetical protein